MWTAIETRRTLSLGCLPPRLKVRAADAYEYLVKSRHVGFDEHVYLVADDFELVVFERQELVQFEIHKHRHHHPERVFLRLEAQQHRSNYEVHALDIA